MQGEPLAVGGDRAATPELEHDQLFLTGLERLRAARLELEDGSPLNPQPACSGVTTSSYAPSAAVPRRRCVSFT